MHQSKKNPQIQKYLNPYTLFMIMERDERIEFIKYLALTKGLMDKTVQLYVEYYDRIDHKRILDQDYCNQFIQKHKNHSVVRGMMLNLLAFRKMNKIIDMPPKKSGSARVRVARDIGLAEINQLKQHLYEKGFKEGLIFELMYQGALRRVEVPTIKISSFKWLDWLETPNKPCYLIVLGKRDKERTVLINPATAEKIFEHYYKKYDLKSMEMIKRWANSESLIFNNLKEYEIYNTISRGSKACLGRNIRPHELRHARATELEAMGVPIRDIKVYLGHSNLATTEIYLHTSDKKSIENISEKLQGETT